ncbi:oxidoreductase [Thalassospira mesophila]|uniref:Oxidoreductase n=1 Tax=Thalassospira mesophila TaxID=1293891 RepID=A0A1Y2KWL8_9PROT|nr:oxidoreductase [Thalassospira mesophila]
MVPANEQVFETECQVISNSPVNNDYRLLVLAAPAEILNCTPGQFFHLQCPVREGLQPYLRRPMSIYGYFPEKGELQFLYKIAGTGTAALATLAPGEPLNVVGPLGQGFDIRDDWQNLLLLARGVGLATLAPLALEAHKRGKTLTAICSARSPEMLMSIDYFRDLGANIITVTDSEETSGLENLEKLIEGLIATNGIDAFYTCGSNRLLKLLQTLGARHNISGQIALEQQMACGLGMCQCCVRSFQSPTGIVHKRVCKEGPVFDLQEAMGW